MSGATYSKLDHDIGVYYATGTETVGMMLARDKNNVPLYEVYDDEYLATQQWTGSASYDSLPAEKEIAIVRDHWVSGFGKEYYDSADPYRYFKTFGFDCRFNRMGILGPVATTITFPTLMTITDGGMEAWDSSTVLTNWTTVKGASDAMMQETTIKDSGTYSAMLAVGDLAVNGLYCKIYQAMGTWLDAFRGATIRITAKLYCTQTNNLRYSIFDGTDTTNSGYVTGDSGWHEVVLSHKFNAAADQCLLTFANTGYSGGESYGYVDTVAYTVTHGDKYFAEFDSDLFIGNGLVLYRVNASTGAVTYATNFPAAITALEAYGSYLMIAIGNSNNYYYMTTAEVFTQAGSVATKFKTVGGTLWKADTTYNVYSSTNGTSWSGATTVGGSDYSITDLLSDGEYLFVAKEDRPFYIDTTAKVLTNDTRSLASSTGGKNPLDWQGKQYFQYGTASLLEYNAGTNTWISPAKYGNNIGEFDGAIQGLAGDDEWLFLAADNSTKVEILAGNYGTIAGATGFVWHPFHEITLTGCDRIYVSSIYQKRLWVASTDSTEGLYYIPLYSSYGDVTNDANRSYLTGGYLETPFHHGNFKADTKAWVKVTLYLGHANDADIYFNVAYKKLNDSSWTPINSSDGTANWKGTATNRVVYGYIPVDGSSINPVSTMMKFKITGVTDSTTTTPVLLSYDIRGYLRPSKRKLINCVVNAGDYALEKQSQQGGLGSYIKTVLDAANVATYPVLFYNIDGTAKYVNFLKVREKPANNPKLPSNMEKHFEILMQEVTIS